MEKRENAPLLEVKNLSVEYRTDAEVVKAVNGVNLSLDAKARRWDWWARPAPERLPPAAAIIGLVQTPPGKVTSGEVYFRGQGSAQENRAGDAQDPRRRHLP